MPAENQIITDGFRHATIKIFNDVDTEVRVVKVDISTLGPSVDGDPCTGVVLEKLWTLSSPRCGAFLLNWESNVAANDATIFGSTFGNSTGFQDFTSFGGITNNAINPTGNINLSILDNNGNSDYTFIFYLRKLFK